MDNCSSFTRCLAGATRTPPRPPNSPQSRPRPLVSSNGNPTSHAELGLFVCHRPLHSPIIPVFYQHFLQSIGPPPDALSSPGPRHRHRNPSASPLVSLRDLPYRVHPVCSSAHTCTSPPHMIQTSARTTAPLPLRPPPPRHKLVPWQQVRPHAAAPIASAVLVQVPALTSPHTHRIHLKHPGHRT